MDRTLPPTPRRLRRALREGDSPLSAVSVRAAAFVAAAAFLPGLGIAVREVFDARLGAALAGKAPVPGDVAIDVATLAAPLVAVGAMTAIAVGVAQTGGFVASARLFRGLRFGASFGVRGYEALRGALAFAIVVAIGVTTLATSGREVVAATDATSLLGLADGVGTRLLGRLAVALVALAAVDALVQRTLWQGRLRMSPRDVADERRESEGAPELRRARREAHAALHRDPR